MAQKKEHKKGIVIKEDTTRNTAPTGKSWFLGIGIDRYQDFPDLHNAVKDVRDIQELLIDKYDVDPDGVLTLFDEEATRESIIDMLDRMVKTVDKNDKLIFYYSGHGFLDKEIDRGYWIPHDAQRGRTANYIRNSTVRDYIKDISSLHTLLISDSCFSGTLFVRGVSRSTMTDNELEAMPSRWAISSGRANEEVYDGDPGKNSPFAESILDVLRYNTINRLNVGKLADRVIYQTRSNYAQLPEGSPLHGVGHKGGQYVFRLKANEAEAWAACRQENTLLAYQTFIENHPDGMHTAAAREKITSLVEEEAWQKAEEHHSLSAYDTFYRKYPKGQYAQQALSAMAALEEEQSWQQALRRNKVATFRQYTVDYPNGKHVVEAEEKIRTILAGSEEQQLWREAIQQDELAAYRRYLEKFPDGRFASEAQVKIDAIEQAAAATQQQAEAARIQQAAQQEEQLWQEAIRQNSVAAFGLYQEQFPDGRFAAEAQSAIEAIEKAQAAARKKEEERAAQQKQEAAQRQQARQERDEQDWQRVVKSASPPAYRQYLKNHPRGAHTAEARQALDRNRRDQIGSALALLKNRKVHIGAGIVVLVLVLMSLFSSKELTVYRDEDTGKFGFVDKSGNLEVEAVFDTVEAFSGREANVVRYGLPFAINKNGNCVANCPTQEQLWDAAAWRWAQEQHTFYAYNGYQIEFPQGNHYATAESRKKALSSTLKRPRDIKNRNYLFIVINAQKQLLLDGELVSPNELTSRIRAFITNPEQKSDLAERPSEAVIYVHYDASVEPTAMAIEEPIEGRPIAATLLMLTYQEIEETYQEIWDELARQKWGLPYSELLPLEKKKQLWQEVPFRLLFDFQNDADQRFLEPYYEGPAPPPPPPPSPVVKEDETFVDQGVEERPAENTPKTEQTTPPPSSTKPEVDDEIFLFAEVMPRFPDAACEQLSTPDEKKSCADRKMMEFINQHLSYPDSARKNEVEGTVVIRFVIDKTGNLTNPEIARDIGSGCGEEALRVVRLMQQQAGRWTPGAQRGKAISVAFSLPFRFKLQ